MPSRQPSNYGQLKRKTNYKIIATNSLSIIPILMLIILAILPYQASSTDVNVSSNSSYTGQLTSYIFTLTNHFKPQSIMFSFSKWGGNIDKPFYSNYTVKDKNTQNQLTCNIYGVSIQCKLNISQSNPIILIISEIKNPSSTKPYQMNVTLNNSAQPLNQKITIFLTISQPRLESFTTLNNYSNKVSAKSMAAGLFFEFNNYVSYKMILDLIYDPDLVTIQPSSNPSAYSFSRKDSGVIQFTNWTKTQTGLQNLDLKITNVAFAISFNIEGTLYFIDDNNGQRYQIQKYTYNVDLVTVPYTNINAVQPDNFIYLGSTADQLKVNLSCSVAVVSKESTNPAYYSFAYSDKLLSIGSGSACKGLSSKTCSIQVPKLAANMNNSIVINYIRSLLSASSTATTKLTFTLKTYSYFDARDAFYPVCSSQLNVDLVPQQLNLSINGLSKCNSVVYAANTIGISTTVEGLQEGDVIRLNGLGDTGIILQNSSSTSDGTEWLKTSVSTAVVYETRVIKSKHVNGNQLKFSFGYLNPTYIPVKTPSFNLSLLRKTTSGGSTEVLIEYGSSVPAQLYSLCEVNLPYSSSTPSDTTLQISDQYTYTKSSDYSIIFKNSSVYFTDYAVGDFLLVSFYTRAEAQTGIAQVECPYQLYTFYGSSSGNSPQVLINGSYSLTSSIVNASSIKITLNQSNAVTIINNDAVVSFVIKINKLSNPPFSSQAYMIIETFTKASLQKQKIRTELSSAFAPSKSAIQAQISDENPIWLLSDNNTIKLTITASNFSKSQLLTVTYSFIGTVKITVTVPFSCTGGLDPGTNSKQLKWQFSRLSTLTVTLTNCSLGYFEDNSMKIQITQTIEYLHSALQQSFLPSASLSVPISSTCTSSCMRCNIDSLSCLECFSKDYSPFNILYTNASSPSHFATCIAQCPFNTFSQSSNSTICIPCHSTCAGCYNSSHLACIACSDSFTYNITTNQCQSVCGSGRYLKVNTSPSQSQTCLQCSINCQQCTSAESCYSCKQQSVLVGNKCVLGSCASPCATCETSISNCLSCVSGDIIDYYLYANQCVQSCPQDTFQWINTDKKYSMQCREPGISVFFVGIILAFVGVMIGMWIKCVGSNKKKKQSLNSSSSFMKDNNALQSNLYGATMPLKQQNQKIQGPNRKNTAKNNGTKGSARTGNNNNGKSVLSILNNTMLTNQSNDASQHSLLKNIAQQNVSTKQYKLNMWRFTVVVLAYAQITSVVVALAQGFQYNPTGVNELFIVGLLGLFLCNTIFGIKYFQSVYKKSSGKKNTWVQEFMSNTGIGIATSTDKKNQQQNQNQINDTEELASPVLSSDDENDDAQLQLTMTISPNIANRPPPESKILKMKKLVRNRVLEKYNTEMLKEFWVMLFSCVFTFKTYRILQSNLFFLLIDENVMNSNVRLTDFQGNQPHQSQNEDGNISNGLGKNTAGGGASSFANNTSSALKVPHGDSNDNSKIDINRTVNSPIKKSANGKIVHHQQNQKSSSYIKPEMIFTATVQPRKSNVIKVESRKQPLSPNRMTMPKRSLNNPKNSNASNNNPIQSTSQPQLQLQSQLVSMFILSASHNPLILFKQKQVKKLIHPFLTYLFICSFLISSVLFIVASIMLILMHRYQAMLFWGIDCLIVVMLGLVMCVLDLWRSVNLTQQAQCSEISSYKDSQQNNQTMENLNDNINDQDAEYEYVFIDGVRVRRKKFKDEFTIEETFENETEKNAGFGATKKVKSSSRKKYQVGSSSSPAKVKKPINVFNQEYDSVIKSKMKKKKNELANMFSGREESPPNRALSLEDEEDLERKIQKSIQRSSQLSRSKPGKSSPNRRKEGNSPSSSNRKTVKPSVAGINREKSGERKARTYNKLQSGGVIFVGQSDREQNCKNRIQIFDNLQLEEDGGTGIGNFDNIGSSSSKVKKLAKKRNLSNRELGNRKGTHQELLTKSHKKHNTSLTSAGLRTSHQNLYHKKDRYGDGQQNTNQASIGTGRENNRKHKKNWKLDDIYLGFVDYQQEGNQKNKQKPNTDEAQRDYVQQRIQRRQRKSQTKGAKSTVSTVIAVARPKPPQSIEKPMRQQQKDHHQQKHGQKVAAQRKEDEYEQKPKSQRKLSNSNQLHKHQQIKDNNNDLDYDNNPIATINQAVLDNNSDEMCTVKIEDNSNNNSNNQHYVKQCVIEQKSQANSAALNAHYNGNPLGPVNNHPLNTQLQLQAVQQTQSQLQRQRQHLQAIKLSSIVNINCQAQEVQTSNDIIWKEDLNLARQTEHIERREQEDVLQQREFKINSSRTQQKGVVRNAESRKKLQKQEEQLEAIQEKRRMEGQYEPEQRE